MTQCRPVEKRDPCTCHFQGPPQLVRRSREEPNPSSDPVRHLSSSARVPFCSSCPLPINVFFNPEICIQNTRLPLGKPQIPNQPSVKCPNDSPSSLWPAPLRGGLTSGSSAAQPASPSLFVASSRQTRGTASEVWDPDHRCVHRWEPGHFLQTQDARQEHRVRGGPFAVSRGFASGLLGLSGFVSQCFKLDLKQKVFLTCVY